MKIKRRHLKRLIERYLNEEEEKEKEELSPDTTLNDYVSALNDENKNDQDVPSHPIPDKVKDKLVKVAAPNVKGSIRSDKKSYTKSDFADAYGPLATIIYNDEGDKA